MIDTNKLRTQELRNTRSLDPIVKLLHNLVRNDLIRIAEETNLIAGVYESGTFTLAADGQSATGGILTGSPEDPGTISGGTGYVIQIDLPTTGGTGTGLTIDINIVDGNGVVSDASISTPGTGYTIGDVITVVGGNNNLTFEILTITNPVLTISTQKRLKLVFFNVTWSLEIGRLWSEGKSDGIIQNVIYKHDNTVGDANVVLIDQTNCIRIDEGVNTLTGQVNSSGITDNSFKIEFTQVGLGYDITGQYHTQG